jgi:ferritin-like metal-binding protein YciE
MTIHDPSHKDLIIGWLNDAYGMEKGLLPVLEEHAKDAKDYPDWSAKAQQFADQCRGHIDLVRKCVEHLGGDVSTIKSGIGAFTGWAKSMGTGMYRDELLKNVLSDYGAAHFAIACYQSLLAAAEHDGDQEIADTCRVIMHDKQEMADWLNQNVNRATEVILHQTVHHGR